MRCFAAAPNVVFAISFCRRTLIVGALSVTLVGCACPAPPQADGCVSPGCLRRTAAVEAPRELKPAPAGPAKPKSKAATAKTAKLTTVVTKTEIPSSDQAPASAGVSEKKAGSSKMMTLQSASSTATTTTTVETKMDAPVSGQPSETSDAILQKAKATIDFVDAKRAIRKNTLGQPIDTICGHVKGKKPSGEEIGARQFLYLVKEDEAYVVTGNQESVPATAYRNICTSADSRIRNIRRQQTRE